MLADLARLQADMDKANAVVGSAMDSIKRNVGIAVQALGTFGAVTTLAGFGALIEKTIQATAELYTLSQRTGVAVEALSALRGVAKLSGTNMDDVATAMQKLSKNMVDAQGGTGKAADTFKALGVSVVDGNGKLKTADQVMLDVAKSMQKFEAGAGLTTAAINIFGKAGANLAPLLFELAEKGALNGKVTTEQAKAAHDFERAQIQLQMAVQGVAKSIAMELVPIIVKMGQLMEPTIKLAAAWFAGFVVLPTVLAAGSAAFTAFAVSVYEGTTAMGAFTGAMAATIATTQAAIVQFGLLKSAMAFLLAAYAGWEFGTWLRNNFMEAQLAGIAFVAGSLQGWEAIKYGAEVAWVAISSAWNAQINVMRGMWALFLEGVGNGLAAMGMDESSAKVMGWAGSMRQAIKDTGTFSDRMATLNAEHEAAKKSITDITDDMADFAIESFKASGAISEQKKQLGGLGDAAVAAKDKQLEAMQALIKATQDRISVLNAQSESLTPLTEGEKKYAELMNTTTAGYSRAALAARTHELALLQLEITMEKTAAARAADQAAITKYLGATQSNIEKLREEAEVQNLNSIALQKITALRQIEKAATDAIFKTRVDELGVVHETMAVTPRMMDIILDKVAADKEETAALLDKINAQKMSVDLAQKVSQLRIDSKVYIDSAAKELAMLDQEAAKQKLIISSLKEESAERAQAQAAFDEWYQASQDKISADKFNAVWQSVDQTAHQTFVDIFNGGQDAFTKLRDTLKSTLLDLLYQMTVKKWVFEIFADVTGAGTAGGAAISAMGGGGAMSTAGSMSSLYNTGSNLYSIYNRVGQFGANALNTIGSGYNALTGGAASNVIGSSAASNLAVTSGGTQVGGSAGLGSGTVLGGGSATAPSAGFMGVPVIGWIMAGMAASGNAYDMGFRGNSDAHGTTNPINWGLNAEDRLIGQPLGLDPKTSAILSGSSLGSLASYAVFGGQTLTDAGGGIQGTLSTTGVNAQQRTDTKEDHRGFLGTGAYTTLNSSYSALDQGTTDVLNGGVTAATAAIKTYASAIGLSADAVTGFTKDVYIDLTGLDSDGIKKKIADTFTSFGDDMVTSAYGSAISALAHSGETSSATLTRLANDLTTVNADLKTLGLSMLPLSVDSAAAAAGLADAAGGLDKLQASVDFYYTHFYSAAEQNANATAHLNDQFTALGVSMPLTRQGFRDLVNSIDITTPAGQHLETQLLALAPAFDTVATAAEQANQKFQQSYASAIKDFGTPQQQHDYTVSQIQSGLQAGGITLSADQISHASRADAVALFNSYAGNQRAQQAILDSASAFASLTPAMNAATIAMGGVGSGSSGGGISGGVIGAADALANAFQSLTDNIFKEVARIRGLVAGPGIEGYNLAQTRFTIATAQARAGDQTAAAALPGLSQALLELAANNAHTLTELKLIQGRTANSLQTTGTMLASQYGLKVPSFDVGTNYVPHDMLAMVHEGEEITPKAYNPAAGGRASSGHGDDMAATLEEVSSLLGDVLTALGGISQSNDKIKKVLVNVTRNGEGMIINDDSLSTGIVIGAS